MIVAAGSSSRAAGATKKQYLPLGDGTVLSQSAEIFLRSLKAAALVVAFPRDEDESRARAALFASEETARLAEGSEIFFARGGETRQDSVRAALEEIERRKINAGVVLVHDAARPFVTEKIISDVADAARVHGAAIPVIPSVDTQKEIDGENFVARHLPRRSTVAAQTPQGFNFKKLLHAHKKAAQTGLSCTDDAEIYGAFEGEVFAVNGDEKNKKITFASDIPAPPSEIRSGLGYDIHRLVEGRALVVGGAAIPSVKGEAGHSDGDALLHAVIDALLGASRLGDVGSFFPPDDCKWKDSDSRALLKEAWRAAREAGWRLLSLDCVVKLEKPKLLPFRERIIHSIACAMDESDGKIFVKAKTGEGLGDVGAGAAIEAQALCLLERKQPPHEGARP